MFAFQYGGGGGSDGKVKNDEIVRILKYLGKQKDKEEVGRETHKQQKQKEYQTGRF